MPERFYTLGELSRAIDVPTYHLAKLLDRGVILPDGENAGRPLFSERTVPDVRRGVLANPPRSSRRNLSLGAPASVTTQ
jgi:hypothetical protein